jgi:hypothetical protein
VSRISWGVFWCTALWLRSSRLYREDLSLSLRGGGRLGNAARGLLQNRRARKKRKAGNSHNLEQGPNRQELCARRMGA